MILGLREIAVSLEQAREITLSVGPFVTVVGLFVDADAAFIHQVLSQVNLHLLQFHGAESREFCESFQRPYLKAIRMKPELDVAAAIAAFPTAAGILLDAYRSGVPGGTGETFDWTRVPTKTKQPIAHPLFDLATFNDLKIDSFASSSISRAAYSSRRRLSASSKAT